VPQTKKKGGEMMLMLILRVFGGCEHGNHSACSAKGGKFFHYMRECHLSVDCA
jgi:hypothetical protein